MKLVVYPAVAPPETTRALQFAGLPFDAVDDPDTVDGTNAVALVHAVDDHDGALGFARALRDQTSAEGGTPAAVLLVVSPRQLDRLEEVRASFDDFVIAPFHPAELEARLGLLRSGDDRAEPAAADGTTIAFGPLRLNPDTYQASVADRPLDLTYMEYELLRFLASQPGIVFTREVLLNRVWGYEYYGGARTVDVHVRRLRAKLGEEHAGLIQTVRSVGYRLAQPRRG